MEEFEEELANQIVRRIIYMYRYSGKLNPLSFSNCMIVHIE